MEDGFEEIIIILKKVFPKLLKDPNMMRGCDISKDEIEAIKLNQELSLEVLSHVGGDCFFKLLMKNSI